GESWSWHRPESMGSSPWSEDCCRERNRFTMPRPPVIGGQLGEIEMHRREGRWRVGVDRALGRLIEGGRWLVLPVALILFLQWPLRDFVQWGSREANDLGQWVFALYVSLAMTFATRERAHLAVDAIAHDYPAPVRAAIARWG